MANAIRLARRIKDIRQVELAERVGISRPYLSQIENGRRPLSPELAVRLFAALEKITRD